MKQVTILKEISLSEAGEVAVELKAFDSEELAIHEMNKQVRDILSNRYEGFSNVYDDGKEIHLMNDLSSYINFKIDSFQVHENQYV